MGQVVRDRFGPARGHRVALGGRLGGHGGDQIGRDKVNRIGLAVLRRDGFVSLNGGTQPGTVVTRPLTFDGAALFVNAEVGPNGTLRAELRDESGAVVAAREYRNLLKQTVFEATRRLSPDWCWSVFEDNAGIVALDDRHAIAFKVETHNHPSAIEPYGGAATGLGGCIRDILGCGLGAKPIAGTDVFCLANPAFDPDRLPQGVLHPRRVLDGVVAGVRDYGNRMGIPTIAGRPHFADRYLANLHAFCGCVCLIPRTRFAKQPAEGDQNVLGGGRTGREGLRVGTV